LGFDVRLARVDVEASIAHVGALQRAGLLDASEVSALEETLVAVGDDIVGGTFEFNDADEDIHSAIERGVTERLGHLGGKLHAGRSRNDLVVTDLRLWLLAAATRIDELAVALAGTLIARAREHAQTVMPGTTHARFAQPVTLGHHLLAHAWALVRDLAA
jgi:argininosuccinate lyase